MMMIFKLAFYFQLQYHTISNGKEKVLKPPTKLNAEDFELNLETPEDVNKFKELTIIPRGLCLNLK